MELALFVYIAGVVGQLSSVLGLICGITILILAFSTYAKIAWKSTVGESHSSDYKTFYKKIVVICLSIIIPCGVLKILLPSEKTIYMMAAGYSAQTVAQSETAEKVLKIINGKLDEYLVDMEKSVKEGAK